MSDSMENVIHVLLYENILLFVVGGFLLLVTVVIQKFGLIYQFYYKIDTETKAHGGKLVAKTLQSHRVEFIFTLTGGHISPILVAAEQIGMRVVDTRHEATAVFAADAVARLSGKIGVAAVTAGPGLTNTITAVKNAQMAESPILLIGGAAATILKGRGALQDIDQMSLFKPLCKFTATISSVRDIVPTLRQAMKVAQSGTPGPVFVEFPIDCLYPYQLVKQEITTSEAPARTLAQKITNWYLNNYLCNLFAGAFEPRDNSPLPIWYPEATSDQIQSCVELITRAKSPVFVIGSQALLPPMYGTDVSRSLTKMGIPCFLGGMSRGVLGRNSPIHIRQNRRAALKEADLVILAGSVCDFRLGYGKLLPKKAKIIAVNRNKKQLYKNSDMFWKPTIAIQGDVGCFIVKLAEKIGSGYSCPSEWIDKLKEGDMKKERENALKAENETNVHLNPIKVLQILEDALPEDSILVADGGDFVGTAAYVLRPRGPLQWLDPGAFGTLGVGGGFALGAKLVHPELEVWVVYGDGSLGYSIAEFDTFKRHNIPILALVGNDAGWTQIEREQVPLFGSSVACCLAFTDYHVVAEGFGGEGFVVGRGDDIRKIIEKARTVCFHKGIPVLVNCLIGKTSFRDGSISV